MTVGQRRLLEELINGTREKESEAIMKSRADNIISSACSLLEDIEATYGEEVALLLERRLLSGIKNKDSKKFRFTKR